MVMWPTSVTSCLKPFVPLNSFRGDSHQLRSGLVLFQNYFSTFFCLPFFHVKLCMHKNFFEYLPERDGDGFLVMEYGNEGGACVAESIAWLRYDFNQLK